MSLKASINYLVASEVRVKKTWYHSNSGSFMKASFFHAGCLWDLLLATRNFKSHRDIPTIGLLFLFSWVLGWFLYVETCHSVLRLHLELLLYFCPLHFVFLTCYKGDFFNVSFQTFTFSSGSYISYFHMLFFFSECFFFM